MAIIPLISRLLAIDTQTISNSVARNQNIGTASNIANLDILDTVEVVESTDKQTIDLSLVSDHKNISPITGFLVEVYLSGSDGRLTKFFREDDLNVDGLIKSEGFSRFLKLEIDVEK